MARSADRRTVTDVRALSALAHPVRAALLSHLMAVGPRTASECAAAVDASPSNISWHLRQLEKFGFVERAADGADGRERPWQAAATGFRFSPDGADEATRATLETLGAVQLEEEHRLARAYLRHEDELDPAWRRTSEFTSYGLLLTPAELRALAAEVDAALRRYLAPTRTDAPADARPVHVFLSAYLRPDAR